MQTKGPPISMAVPLTDHQLLALAPTDLVSYRTDRYAGDGIQVTLAAFAPADQQRLAQVYTALQALLPLVTPPQSNPAATLQALHATLDQIAWDTVVQAVQALGRATPVGSATLQQVIHDVRGGSFTALAMAIDLLRMGMGTPTDLQRVFVLTRDQLKMLRNGVADLDPPQTSMDARHRLHPVALLVEKWQQAVYPLPTATAQIQIAGTAAGVIAERCQEFSAVDRMLYNLITNAARHTTDGRVAVTLLGLPAAQPQHLRIVIANPISAAHRQRLEMEHPAPLGDLFHGGFTTGGSGLGMRIAGTFVAQAYGVPTLTQCIAGGYVGATLIDTQFTTWVHWPLVLAK